MQKLAFILIVTFRCRHLILRRNTLSRVWYNFQNNLYTQREVFHHVSNMPPRTVYFDFGLVMLIFRKAFVIQYARMFAFQRKNYQAWITKFLAILFIFVVERNFLFTFRVSARCSLTCMQPKVFPNNDCIQSKINELKFHYRLTFKILAQRSIIAFMSNSIRASYIADFFPFSNSKQ